MKKTRILKIAMTLAALALLACASVGIAVSAANGPEIVGINVAYNEDTHIAIGVDGITSENVGIAVWYDETNTEDFTLANSDYRNYELKEDSKGNKYFKTHAIASDEYADGFVVSLVVDGQLAGEKYTVSVVKYLNNRIFGDDAVTVNQDDLYSDMLIHGIAADLSIGDCQPSYIVVKTVNGTAGSRNAHAAPILDGKAVMIRAEAKNAAGEYFLYWTAPDGSQIPDRVTAVAPTAKGINTYTAVYGAAADSAYANTIDFEGYAVGEFEYDLPTTALAHSTYGTAPNLEDLYFWKTTKTTSDNRLTIEKNFESTSKYLNQTFAPEMVVNQDYVYIVEGQNGDKEMVISKPQSVNGQNVRFYNPGGTAAKSTSVEFDLVMKEWNAKGPIRITVFYGTGSADMRFYIRHNANGFYLEQDGGAKGSTSTVGYPAGCDKTVTVRIDFTTVTDEGNTYLGAYVYFDGVCVNNATPVFNSMDAVDTAADRYNAISSIGIFNLKNEICENVVDNLTFMK